MWQPEAPKSSDLHFRKAPCHAGGCDTMDDGDLSALVVVDNEEMGERGYLIPKHSLVMKHDCFCSAYLGLLRPSQLHRAPEDIYNESEIRK